MNESTIIKNKGKIISIIGLCLFISGVIIGPPITLLFGVLGMLMVFIGGRIHNKSLPPQTPLSQQPAINKIIYAGPASIILLSFAYYFETKNALVQGLGLFLLAYAIVGILELIFNKQIPVLSAKWDNWATWKKFATSIVIIIFCLILAMITMPFIAKIIYA